MQRVTFTVREAATHLGLSRHSVYRLIRAGAIKPVRFSPRGRLLIPSTELVRLSTVKDGH